MRTMKDCIKCVYHLQDIYEACRDCTRGKDTFVDKDSEKGKEVAKQLREDEDNSLGLLNQLDEDHMQEYGTKWPGFRG